MDAGAQLNRYFEAVATGTESLEAIHDRHFTTPLDYSSDGVRLDRDGLLAHARTVRTTVRALRLDVEALVRDGRQQALRGTLRATLRGGGVMAAAVFLFATLAADGRLSQVVQLSRQLSREP